MNELRLIGKEVKHTLIGSAIHEAITTSYEFTHLNKVGGWCKVTHRHYVSQNENDWRVFEAEGMRQWSEGEKKDRRKLQIEEEIKNWFDTNNIFWHPVKSYK